MSELRRLLKQAVGATDPAQLVGCVIAANAALEAHDREIAVAAAREEMEATCVLLCQHCGERVPLEPPQAGSPHYMIREDWHHRWPNGICMKCHAHDIRADFARRHPEVKP